MTIDSKEKTSSWLSKPFPGLSIRWEVFLFILIVILAVITRFYDLGTRVMSHDESLHTYFSWVLYRGDGFSHTPLMHGPFQFNVIALFYYLFGDSDFTARIPAALFSILSVVFLWKYRRYLGNTGALAASFLFVISPFMLYYGRYVRNEAYVIFFGIVAIWSTLRYLDTGENKYLYYLTAATALHFTSKETSFIYVAQTLIFVGFVFLSQLFKREWIKPEFRNIFLILLILSGLMFASGLTLKLAGDPEVIGAEEIVAPADPESGSGITEAETPDQPLETGLLVGGGISLIISLALLASGYGLENLRKMRSFGLMILQLFLVVPHLSAFLIRWAKLDPMNYTTPVVLPFLPDAGEVDALVAIGIFLVPLILISFAVGMWWNSREWLINNAIFYVIFIVFFTTIFTNGSGFFSGLVGSLGYWLEQQGVRRGSQPSYYYALVQIPVYEFLSAIGTLAAVWIGARKWWNSPAKPSQKDKAGSDPTPEESKNRAILFFGYWTASSFLAYTLAGEKMPWLAAHIALPMILVTGWVIGELVDRFEGEDFKEKLGWIAFGLLPVFWAALGGLIVVWISTSTPFEGKTLTQLEDTSTFMLALLTALGVLIGLFNIFKTWKAKHVTAMVALSLFTVLTMMTMRAAFIATYVNYDRATEYLVYAHSARGVKDVMERVEDISLRTTDGLAIVVAYDDDVSWPFSWYLRNYTNRKYYGADPTRDLREASIIIVGDNNFSKIEPIVAQGYYRFDYIRMWWPMQDYFDLTRERVTEYLTDPLLREGLFNIWLTRDYTAYGNAVGRDYTLPNWSPADRMRMYIRKDVVAQLWDYGVGPGEGEIIIDPYEGKQLALVPDQSLSTTIEGNNLFFSPRGLDVSPNGDIYVTDSKNHRIVVIRDGEVINTWGSYGVSTSNGEPAPGGTFNEPWGIAVSGDGEFVFVADTWNHRIQKFTAEGEFITMWGVFEQTDDPYSFWGPRDVAAAPNGNILVSNTGNKRITEFTPEGDFISQFGEVGFGPGEFDEPVGIAVNQETGWVYVADTWNQRVQVFAPNDTIGYTPVTMWDINGWYGQSLENKPYIAVDGNGNVYITDPELSRILVYAGEGEFLNYFGDAGIGPESIGIASGVAVDPQGNIWVTDGQGNRLLHFTLP